MRNYQRCKEKNKRIFKDLPVAVKFPPPSPRLLEEHSEGSSLAEMKSVIDKLQCAYRKRIAVRISCRNRVLINIDIGIGRIFNTRLSGREVTFALNVDKYLQKKRLAYGKLVAVRRYSVLKNHIFFSEKQNK